MELRRDQEASSPPQHLRSPSSSIANNLIVLPPTPGSLKILTWMLPSKKTKFPEIASAMMRAHWAGACMCCVLLAGGNPVLLSSTIVGGKRDLPFRLVRCACVSYTHHPSYHSLFLISPSLRHPSVLCARCCCCCCCSTYTHIYIHYIHTHITLYHEVSLQLRHGVYDVPDTCLPSTYSFLPIFLPPPASCTYTLRQTCLDDVPEGEITGEFFFSKRHVHTGTRNLWCIGCVDCRPLLAFLELERRRRWRRG